MAVKIFIKPLNSCVQRRQNIQKWSDFVERSTEYELAGTMEDADEIWVWTCAFREDMKQNSLEYLGKINGELSGKKILVGGCMPDIDPKETQNYKKMCVEGKKNSCEVVPWRKEIEYFKEDYLKVDKMFCEPAFSEDIEVYKREHPNESVTFCDQFIKAVISEGCNCECVYCSERRMFPKYRSFEPDVIKHRCEELIKETGVYHVVLVADSLGEYGCDLNGVVNLPMLIQSILDIDSRVKVALNNLNPQYMSLFYEEVKNFIINQKVVHINLPIQSACDKVLKDMKRKYTKRELQKIVDMFAECNFTNFDTHILVGFDGETRDEFQETLEFIVDNKVRYVLASKYMDVLGSEIGEREYSVTDEEKERRIKEAYKKCTDAGIIINCDGSSINKERMRRISY